MACSEADCKSEVIARGLCRKHYGHHYNAGTLPPKAPPKPPAPVGERLRRYLQADGDCIVWTGYVDPNGYGKITVDGRSRWVHRVAWEEERGPVPEGLTLDHLCRRPLCCNTDHLEPVTHAENMRRAVDANRSDTCPHGHPRTPENRMANGPGRTRCRPCHNSRERTRTAEVSR